MTDKQSRKEAFFQLFPDMCSAGQLNGEALCQELGVSLSTPANAASHSEHIHEIRNIAAIIQSGVKILQRQLRNDQNASAIIQTVMQAVENLTQLVKKPS